MIFHARSAVLLSHPVQFGGMVFHFEQLGQSLGHLQDSVLTPLPEEALALLETTSVNVLWFLVILVSVHLFMSEWPRMRDWLIDLAPPAYHDDMRELYKRLRNVWMAYLRGQIVLMIMVGIVFTIAWLIIGIPGALGVGSARGAVSRSIPDVGPSWRRCLQWVWHCWKVQVGFRFQIFGWQVSC